jgi:hypothetical protein
MKKVMFPLNHPCQFAQYQEKIHPKVIRTEMEGGLPKQALRYSSTLVERQVLYHVKEADYHRFKTWFYTEAHYGASWFDWSNPVTQHTHSARIVNGEIEAVPLSADHTQWQLRFVLETLE